MSVESMMRRLRANIYKYRFPLILILGAVVIASCLYSLVTETTGQWGSGAIAGLTALTILFAIRDHRAGRL